MKKVILTCNSSTKLITLGFILVMIPTTFSKLTPNQEQTKAKKSFTPENYIFNENELLSPIDLPSFENNYSPEMTKKFNSLTEFWKANLFCQEGDDSQDRPVFGITTEKPVYKPEESVKLMILCYDRFSKKPLSMDLCTFDFMELKILDPVDVTFTKQALSRLNGDTLNNMRIIHGDNKFSKTVEVDLPLNVKGGKYTVNLHHKQFNYTDKTQFVISAYRMSKEKLILDLNKDTLAPEDDLIAKVSLKILGNDPSAEDDYDDHQELTLKYEIMDNMGNALINGTKKLKHRVGYIMYTTPGDLTHISSLDLNVSLFYKGRFLRASRQLFSVNVDDIQIDFNPSSGNFVSGRNNKIFFQVFGDFPRTLPTQITKAKVVKICKENVEKKRSNTPSKETENAALEEIKSTSIYGKFYNILKKIFSSSEKKSTEPKKASILSRANLQQRKTRVSSDVNFYDLPQNEFSNKDIIFQGEVIVSDINSDHSGRGSFNLNLESKCSYYFQIEKSNILKNFFITNTDPKYFSFDQSDMHLELNKTVFNPSEKMIIQVTKPAAILATHCLVFIQDKGRVLLEKKVSFDFCKGKLKSKICFSSLEVEVNDLQMAQGGVFTVQVYRDKQFYAPEQEALVFVFPREKVDIGLELDKEYYAPGDEVEVTLTFDQGKGTKEDTPMLYGVVVSDESAFLQLEKRNLPPTLLTKIFMEKEMKKNKGLLEYSHDYINWFFESNIQYSEQNYFKIIKNTKELNMKVGTLAERNIELLLGTQNWRKMFLSAKGISQFANLQNNNYEDYLRINKEFARLEYNFNTFDYMVQTKEFEDDFMLLLPGYSKDLFQKCPAFTNFGQRRFYRARGGRNQRLRKKNGRNDQDGEEEEMMMDMMVPEMEVIPMMGEPMMMNMVIEESMEEKDASAYLFSENLNRNESGELNQESQDDLVETDSGVETETVSRTKEEDYSENTVFYSSLQQASVIGNKIKFKLPKEISKFRISTFAVSKEGVYGYRTDFVNSQKPFSVQIEYPSYIYEFEKIELHVTYFNNQAKSTTVTSEILEKPLVISPNSLYRSKLMVLGTDLPKIFRFKDDVGNVESIKVTPEVRKGIFVDSVQTYLLKKDTTFTQNKTFLSIPKNVIASTLSGAIQYEDLDAPLLLKGYKRLIKEPYGCFEQTSSATFPMVILMQYLNLQSNDDDNEEIDQMKFDISQKLKKGVEKLLSYESSTGGFDWFGRSPGHPTLTAYGLWQFMELNKIGDYIDPNIIDRTLNWLKKQYNESSKGFDFHPGYDSFGRPDQAVSDIYILFVMSLFDVYQIDYSNKVEATLEMFEKVDPGLDSYKLGVSGLLYQSLQRNDKTKMMAQKLIKNQDPQTGQFKNSSTSITSSRGKSLALETTALGVLFLINEQDSKYLNNVEKAMDFILSNMEGGYFTSTQATILCMKAVVEYSILKNRNKSGIKKFSIKIQNQEKTYSVDFTKDNQRVEHPLMDWDLASLDLSQPIYPLITPEFSMENADKFIFSLNYKYSILSPLSKKNSPLSLKLDQNECEEFCSYEVTVSNDSSEELGMVNVIFYVPSGLTVNLNNLEGLQKLGIMDYYELMELNSKIVFYWTGMDKQSTFSFKLNFSREFNVENEFNAKIAGYLYYDKDGSLVYA